MHNIKGMFNTSIEQYKLPKYLFEGVIRGRYSERSLEYVVKNAIQTVKITKQLSPYVLRHLFAIQLLENAVDISYTHQLLGHSIKQ